jgi:hypothetical protein
MNGDLDSIIEALITEDQRRKMEDAKWKDQIISYLMIGVY